MKQNEKLEKLDVLKILGKNIRCLRLLHGLSQEALASELQKSVNFISLLENGKSGLSIQTIVDICRVLRVNVNEIFEGIIPNGDIKDDSFIINSLSLFDKDDKEIVLALIKYIINSKN